MKIFITIMLTGILTENFVLSKFLGICPFLGVSKKLNTAMGMSAAVIFVMVLATAATWPINNYILQTNNLEYLQTIVFILVIAALVQLVEIILKKYMPPLYKSLGIYLPLITTNCAVLGVAVMNARDASGFATSVLFGFAAAVGFAMALLIFAGIRERLDHAYPPKAFRGIALALVTAGLLSLAFMGFSGLV